MRGKLLTTKPHQAANENLCLTDRGKTNLMGCANLCVCQKFWFKSDK